MSHLRSLYGNSLALLTDLYELTMAYAFWKLDTPPPEAAFHLTFRRNPFDGGYAIACGLSAVIEFLERFAFDEADLEYLATLRGNDAKPLFEREFLEHLRNLRFTCDVDAIPEGTVVFPQEPLLRVTGPVIQCQLLETALLNLTNFETLIATKAARICQAARGENVIEFGLRRAQGIDGGVSASRAAYVGGCVGTSNVLAGRIFGIPVLGTHAHSWVMSFADEGTAFRKYAEAMPNNCILLVDTYDSLDGVRHAVEIGKWLRERGHRLAGVRLDSGDLAYLSIEARKILDSAGFNDTSIVASNDLDEHIVASLKEQGATINIWGVGTKLATGHDQGALGGVYKLTAVRWAGGDWEPRIKLAEQRLKVSIPGKLQVRRFRDGDRWVGDIVYDVDLGIENRRSLVDPMDATRRKRIAAAATHEELLVPIFRNGRAVYEAPPLAAIRERARAQLAQLHPGVRRFVNPHEYPVGLEERLNDVRTRLILEARGRIGGAPSEP
ncbi:MAG: nicotinate phosphoribosyltransferase [Planctomycetota bacterium]